MRPLRSSRIYDFVLGKEFEVLIDSHGPEHVTPLMQKVISALEDLEKLASTRDQEKETIDSLKTTISHLEIEDTKKKEETQRNAKVSITCHRLISRFLCNSNISQKSR